MAIFVVSPNINNYSFLLNSFLVITFLRLTFPPLSIITTCVLVIVLTNYSEKSSVGGSNLSVLDIFLEFYVHVRIIMILSQWSYRSGECYAMLFSRYSQRSNKNISYVIASSISHNLLPATRYYIPPSNNKRSQGDGMYCGSSYAYLVSPRLVHYVSDFSILSFTREKTKIFIFCFIFMLTTDRQADIPTAGSHSLCF